MPFSIGIHSHSRESRFLEVPRAALETALNQGLLFDRFVEAALTEGNAQQLEQSLSANRENAPAYAALLGHWHLHRDQPEKAIRAFADLTPAKVPGIDYWKAVALYRNKQIDEAIQKLDLAVGDNSLPDSRRESIPRLKGRWLIELGRTEAALAVWSATLTPDAPDDRFEDILSLQVREGRFEAAIVTARQLISRTKDPYRKNQYPPRVGGSANRPRPGKRGRGEFFGSTRAERN